MSCSQVPGPFSKKLARSTEGLVGMKVDSVKFQVVLFVFHVPGDRGTVFSTIQVQAQLDPYW